MAANDSVLDFRWLVGTIRDTHNEFASQSGRAVNVCLTLRNWLIGCYIAEFQLRGTDRAAYGERLLDELASALRKRGVSSSGRRQLYGYLAFYRTYPQIVQSLPAQSRGLVPLPASHVQKVRSVTAQSPIPADELVQKLFEFLGIKPREVMGESDLEDALLDRLQEFLLELGNGFCYEARQRRILIGDTYGFIDLVFYHRILRCHVLIELKVAAFNHEQLGQLNTYVSWYRRNIMRDGDSPPIGIPLCTQKDHALVEYALAGLDNQLFVSKYQLELPAKEELQRFLERQIKEVGNGG